MKPSPFLSPLLFLAACASSEEPYPPYDPLPWADPMIATGGQGYGQGSAYPGAAAPFGLVALSPDSRSLGAHFENLHNSGYWYDDEHLVGFSHIHLHGTGAPDYGTVLFHPADGMEEAFLDDEGRITGFSHDHEHASPGYYRVQLEDGIVAELSAGQRIGAHRYSFPAGSQPTVIIDLEHALAYAELEEGLQPAEIEIDALAGTVSGLMHTAGSLSGRHGGFLVHFYAVFDPPFESWGTWSEGVMSADSSSAQGIDLGGWLEFPTQDSATEVQALVGISYTSADQARANLAAEAEGADFDSILAETQDSWRSWLGHVRVWGGDERQRTIFHSALYHVLLMPNLLSDADGSYIGFDGQLRSEPGEPFYSDMSMWDTYRTLHPLMTLAWPEAQNHFANSLVRMAEQGGYLPRWPCNKGYGSSMVGDPADIVLAGSYLKGVDDWDVQTGYQAAKLGADGPTPDGALYGGRSGIEGYLERGWVAADETDSSVAKTMEYTWADHALGRWAQALGQEQDAERYLSRARYYVNLWDEESQFFRGRAADGSFSDLADFSETAWEAEYEEGNAWQYLWLAPQDPLRLAGLMGGPEAMLERLDEFFALSAEDQEDIWPDSYYWHGNEPDLHAPYLYALLDEPARGAPWVRWVRETRYGTGPDGLDGNDDGGTLSAWYVLSALGLYPVAGTETYALGPPVFERAEVDLLHGTLVVEANGPESLERGAWSAVLLNGEAVEGGTLSHSQIAEGGHLLFLFGPDQEGVESDREGL